MTTELRNPDESVKKEENIDFKIENFFKNFVITCFHENERDPEKDSQEVDKIAKDLTMKFSERIKTLSEKRLSEKRFEIYEWLNLNTTNPYYFNLFGIRLFRYWINDEYVNINCKSKKSTLKRFIVFFERELSEIEKLEERNIEFLAKKFLKEFVFWIYHRNIDLRAHKYDEYESYYNVLRKYYNKKEEYQEVLNEIENLTKFLVSYCLEKTKGFLEKEGVIGRSPFNSFYTYTVNDVIVKLEGRPSECNINFYIVFDIPHTFKGEEEWPDPIRRYEFKGYTLREGHKIFIDFINDKLNNIDDRIKHNEEQIRKQQGY